LTRNLDYDNDLLIASNNGYFFTKNLEVKIMFNFDKNSQCELYKWVYEDKSEAKIELVSSGTLEELKKEACKKAQDDGYLDTASIEDDVTNMNGLKTPFPLFKLMDTSDPSKTGNCIYEIRQSADS
jgi:hypothetical protein